MALCWTHMKVWNTQLQTRITPEKSAESSTITRIFPYQEARRGHGAARWWTWCPVSSGWPPTPLCARTGYRTPTGCECLAQAHLHKQNASLKLWIKQRARTCEDPSDDRTEMAPAVSGSTPIAHPAEAAASALSSTGSSEREASQGSLGSASARSFARALARALDFTGSAAAGVGTRRRQRRERKGGAKKAAAASQCSVEWRRAVERRAFMGSWRVAGVAAAAEAAAIIRKTEAEWEGERFLLRSGDKASGRTRRASRRLVASHGQTASLLSHGQTSVTRSGQTGVPARSIPAGYYFVLCQVGPRVGVTAQTQPVGRSCRVGSAQAHLAR